MMTLNQLHNPKSSAIYVQNILRRYNETCKVLMVSLQEYILQMNLQLDIAMTVKCFCSVF